MNPSQVDVSSYRSGIVCEDREDCVCVDPTAVADDVGARRHISVGAGAAVVDAQDETVEVSLAIRAELGLEVLGGPVADDLEEPASPRVVSVDESEIGEDEGAADWDRLWFADDDPVRRSPHEVMSETLLDGAVISFRLVGRHERIARPKVKAGLVFGELAGRKQVKRVSPRESG